MRERMKGVVAMSTRRKIIEASEGQSFYQLPKSIELWQDEPLQRIIRISHKRVFWIMVEGDE